MLKPTGVRTIVTMASAPAQRILVVDDDETVCDLARAVDRGPVRLECRGLPDELQSVADELEGASLRLSESAARESAMDLSRRELVAVRNLLDNAIHHTPAGGRVEVAARLDGARAVVEVADACGGLAEHDLDRVFDLAYRGDAARTPGDDRAGLGLAIAKGLVEAHHGTIAVANAGAGCRFTVSLPLADGALT